MKIVVNTNRIIAALIKDSMSRKIILHGNAEFIVIQSLENEVAEHKDSIIKKANISESEFEIILQKLYEKMISLDDAIILSKMKEASQIMDTIDHDDTPFVAAALATEAAIWSDDKHFQQQKKVKIHTTAELHEMLF